MTAPQVYLERDVRNHWTTPSEKKKLLIAASTWTKLLGKLEEKNSSAFIQWTIPAKSSKDTSCRPYIYALPQSSNRWTWQTCTQGHCKMFIYCSCPLWNNCYTEWHVQNKDYLVTTFLFLGEAQAVDEAIAEVCDEGCLMCRFLWPCILTETTVCRDWKRSTNQ